MTRQWKPCGDLAPSDFDISPVWGFDTSREDASDESDETWVRPYSFENVPELTDTLFVRAQLKTRDGRLQTGAVVVQFSEGRPELLGVVLLAPSYCAATLEEDVVPAGQRDYVETILPCAKELFPLEYEAALPIAGEALTFRGTARLGW